MPTTEQQPRPRRPKRTFQMSEADFREGDEAYEGRCLECGDEAQGVEPDARRYTCDSCGEPQVYGLQELLLMGRIEITD